MHRVVYQPKFRIRCSLCDKLVDRIDVEINALLGVTHIKAYCHGDRDRMTLTEQEIDRFGKEFVGQEGVAFAPKLVVSGGADYSTAQPRIRGN